MLKSKLSETDRKYILDAIKELKDVRNSNFVEKLSAKKVVGVTCAASSFEILANSKFAIVILDECSQMVEPSSIMPLFRFAAERYLNLDFIQLYC